ncbi:hypothetical protein HME9302_02449 [Alteripontixanthobacter maritimus]|uniref:DAGKc domain-containing protein n=1 Tax=Alteripontixanthobacter maritimus TaxID=2161824 RepID=A0A369QE93_9SPHN|nr:acylglycerol kinase family protein [Alteripontixanthobacter maritimus]RDC61229.1 hypothetical protein HME9302_02449 [Alteripontixanthobacter maritimus]
MPGPIKEFSSLPARAELRGDDAVSGSITGAGSGGVVAFRQSSVRREGVPRIGVIYNPRSHGNKGRDLALHSRGDNAPDIAIATPGKRRQMPAQLEEFARSGIDYLIINGGDGTVRDVLTCGQPFFGDNWPRIAVLPKGKTNALNVDLGAPKDWTLDAAIDALDSGREVRRRPLAIEPLDHSAGVLQGFILGAGAFTRAIRAGQGAHRIGAFNSMVVGVTTGWAMSQILLGGARNKYRRGVKMELLLGDRKTPLPHSGLGEEDRRMVLFASTLKKMPFRLQPFGKRKGAIRLAAMDRPLRRYTPLLPAVAAGLDGDYLAGRGFHRAETDRLEMHVEGQFILDGEAFPPGNYSVTLGPELCFVVP